MKKSKTSTKAPLVTKPEEPVMVLRVLHGPQGPRLELGDVSRKQALLVMATLMEELRLHVVFDEFARRAGGIR